MKNTAIVILLLIIAGLLAERVGRTQGTFTITDAGQQITSDTQNDIWEKVRQQIETGNTEIYLHNLSVTQPEKGGPVYSAHVLGVQAAN